MKQFAPIGVQSRQVSDVRDVIRYSERPLARTAGSARFAFVDMDLPMVPVLGPATGNLRQLRIMQPMVRAFMQVQTLQSLGGLQAGQMYRQPLINPDRPGF